MDKTKNLSANAPAPAREPARKPYAAPQLTRLGRMSERTLVGGRTFRDIFTARRK